MAPFLALTFALGCTTPRYVGSLVRDETFVNRGYGVVLRVAASNTMVRWAPVDPAAIDDAPPELRPRFSDSPLDVDGDGKLDVLERTGHLDPPLRLYSADRKSTIDLEVQILGGKDQTLPLDALIYRDLSRWLPTSSAAIALAVKERTDVNLEGGFRGRQTEVDVLDVDGRPQRLRVAWIDQDQFVGEEEIERRQLVRLVMRGPEIGDAMRADFQALLKHLLLSRRGSSTTSRESW